jgi:hypothetical protein
MRDTVTKKMKKRMTGAMMTIDSRMNLYFNSYNPSWWSFHGKRLDECSVA